jgi:hypothetical protein
MSQEARHEWSPEQRARFERTLLMLHKAELETELRRTRNLVLKDKLTFELEGVRAILAELDPAPALSTGPALPPPVKVADTCPKGHTYTDDNTYINSRNHRQCRTCTAARQARWRYRKYAEQDRIKIKNKE